MKETPIETLIPYVRNPRKNDAVVNQMIASIKEFGFRIPVVARSDGTLIDGHLRLKAAIQMGMTTVPVVLADELTDAQVKAFRLLANRSANWAEWDNEMLALELKELEEKDYDLAFTGFDDSQLKTLMNAPEFEFNDATGGAVRSKELLLKVRFENEDSMQFLFDELNSRGYAVSR